MTALESRRPHAKWKNMAGQTLFVLVMLLMMRFLWVRTQPERVKYTPSTNSIVFGDDIYFLAAYPVSGESIYPFIGRKYEPTIKVESIYDVSRQRILGKEDASLHFGRQFSGEEDKLFSLMGDKLYYVVEPLPKSIFGVDGGGGGSTSDQFLGTFLRPQNSPPGTNAEQKQLDSGPTYLGVRDVRFRQISLHGGTPRDAATFRTARVSLLGNQVFWVRPGPEERSATIRMQEDRNRPYWREVTAHSDLMLTSLTNGVTRCIRHGIPYNTNLHAGEVGVAWIEAAPFPEPPTLFYARVSDGSVRSLGAPAKENEFTNWASKHFAEFGNRLYWLSVSQNGNDPSVLVSANLNGKDIRNVCTQRDSHPMDVRSLHGYKGNLYCCIVEPPVMSPGVAPRNQYLCRVHPARADPLEIVYQLPKGFAFDQLDGGYLYLIRSELKRSLWATITDDPGGALTVDTHYRISLDR